MRPVSLLFHDVYESDPGESGFRSPAADRYKLSLHEFEAQLDGLCELRIPSPESRIPTRIPTRIRHHYASRGDGNGC
jgi:hypothetical protein